MLAIIPARGGSKGLPGKNIKDFCGKPLISYAISEAKKSKYIKRVIVSTDDVDIAKVALEYGAEVPFMRPEALAKDASAALDTYFYTIEEIRKIEGIFYQDFIILLPTAPLRNYHHIDEAIDMYYERKADSIISVCTSDHPIEWTRIVDEKGVLKPFFEGGNKNRQDYKDTFYPNGQIYIFNYNALKKSKEYYMEKTYPYITDKKYYADIDDIDDFLISEFKYHLLYNRE